VNGLRRTSQSIMRSISNALGESQTSNESLLRHGFPFSVTEDFVVNSYYFSTVYWMVVGCGGKRRRGFPPLL